jgi:hypothetical protein
MARIVFSIGRVCVRVHSFLEKNGCTVSARGTLESVTSKAGTCCTDAPRHMLLQKSTHRIVVQTEPTRPEVVS